MYDPQSQRISLMAQSSPIFLMGSPTNRGLEKDQDYEPDLMNFEEAQWQLMLLIYRNMNIIL